MTGETPEPPINSSSVLRRPVNGCRKVLLAVCCVVLTASAVWAEDNGFEWESEPILSSNGDVTFRCSMMHGLFGNFELSSCSAPNPLPGPGSYASISLFTSVLTSFNETFGEDAIKTGKVLQSIKTEEQVEQFLSFADAAEKGWLRLKVRSQSADATIWVHCAADKNKIRFYEIDNSAY